MSRKSERAKGPPNRNLESPTPGSDAGSGGPSRARKSGGKVRGFAAWDPDKRRKVAAKGGKRGHELGVSHEFTSEEAKREGRKGGNVVLAKYGPEHFAKIGAKGGRLRGERRKQLPLFES